MDPRTQLRELAASVRSGERSARSVVEDCAARIEDQNPRLTAFVHLAVDDALAAADLVDGRLAGGEDPGPLAGLPFGVKDLEDCAGMPTREGSALTDASPATADSPLVGRLRAAGAIPIGKTAVPEFGWGTATATRAFGVTRNP